MRIKSTWYPVCPFQICKAEWYWSLYLSNTSVSVVTLRRSKLWKVSFASALVCTKLSNKHSFKVLYRPGGAMSNPKQWATMAENLQGEPAVAFNSSWKLALILCGSVGSVLENVICFSTVMMHIWKIKMFWSLRGYYNLNYYQYACGWDLKQCLI